MWAAVELLRHHTQELGLVLAAIVVGGADVHQLEGDTKRTGVKGGAGGRRDTGTSLCGKLLVSQRHRE